MSTIDVTGLSKERIDQIKTFVDLYRKLDTTPPSFVGVANNLDTDIDLGTNEGGFNGTVGRATAYGDD